MSMQQGLYPVVASHEDESPLQVVWTGGEESPCPFALTSWFGAEVSPYPVAMMIYGGGEESPCPLSLALLEAGRAAMDAATKVVMAIAIYSFHAVHIHFLRVEREVSSSPTRCSRHMEVGLTPIPFSSSGSIPRHP